MNNFSFDPAIFSNYFYNVECWFKSAAPVTSNFSSGSFDEMWQMATQQYPWLNDCYVDSDGAILEFSTNKPVHHYIPATRGTMEGMVVVKYPSNNWAIVQFKDTETDKALTIEQYPKFLPDGFIRYRQNLDNIKDRVKATVKVKYCTRNGEKIVARDPDGRAILTLQNRIGWKVKHVVTPREQIADYLFNSFGITLEQFFQIVEVQDLLTNDTAEPASTEPATHADYQLIITARKSTGGIYSKDVGYDGNGNIRFEIRQGRGRYSTGYLSYNKKGDLVFERAKCSNIILDLKKRLDDFKKSGAEPARIIAVDAEFYFFTIFNYSAPRYESDSHINLDWWIDNLPFIDFFRESPDNILGVYKVTNRQQTDYSKRVYLDFSDNDRRQESEDCIKLRDPKSANSATDNTPPTEIPAPATNVEDTPATDVAITEPAVDVTAPVAITEPAVDITAPVTDAARNLNSCTIPVVNLDAALDVESKIRANFPQIDFNITDNIDNGSVISRALSFTGSNDKSFSVIIDISSNTTTGKIYLDGKKIDDVTENRLNVVLKYIKACKKSFDAPKPSKTITARDIIARRKAESNSIERRRLADNAIGETYAKQGVIYEKGNSPDVKALNTALENIANPNIVYGSNSEPYSDVITIFFTSISDNCPCSAMYKLRAGSVIAGKPCDWNIRSTSSDLPDGANILHPYSVVNKDSYSAADFTDGIFRAFHVFGSNKIFLINTNPSVIKFGAERLSKILTKIIYKQYTDDEIAAIEATEPASIDFNPQAANDSQIERTDSTMTFSSIMNTIRSAMGIDSAATTEPASTDPASTAEPVVDLKHFSEGACYTNLDGSRFVKIVARVDSRVDLTVTFLASQFESCTAPIVVKQRVETFFFNGVSIRADLPISEEEFLRRAHNAQIELACGKINNATILAREDIVIAVEAYHGFFADINIRDAISAMHAVSAGNDHSIQHLASSIERKTSDANYSKRRFEHAISKIGEHLNNFLRAKRALRDLLVDFTFDGDDSFIDAALNTEFPVFPPIAFNSDLDVDVTEPAVEPTPVVVDTPEPIVEPAPAVVAVEIDAAEYTIHPDAFLDANDVEIALAKAYSVRLIVQNLTAASDSIAAFATIGNSIAVYYAVMCSARANLDAVDNAANRLLLASFADFDIITRELASLTANVYSQIDAIIDSRHDLNHELEFCAAYLGGDLGVIANDVDQLLRLSPDAVNDSLVAALLTDFNAQIDAECDRINAALELVYSIQTPLEAVKVNLLRVNKKSAPATDPAPAIDPAPATDPAPANNTQPPANSCTALVPVGQTYDYFEADKLYDDLITDVGRKVSPRADLIKNYTFEIGKDACKIIQWNKTLRGKYDALDNSAFTPADKDKIRKSITALELKISNTRRHIDADVDTIARNIRSLDAELSRIANAPNVTTQNALQLRIAGDIAFRAILDIRNLAFTIDFSYSPKSAFLQDYSSPNFKPFDSSKENILSLENDVTATPEPATDVDTAPADSIEQSTQNDATATTEPATVEPNEQGIQALIEAFDTAITAADPAAAKAAFDNIFNTFNPIRAEYPLVHEVLAEIENTYSQFKASLAGESDSTPATKKPAASKKKVKPEPTALDNCKAAFLEASKLQTTEFVAKADIALADWRKAIAAAGDSDTAIAEYNAAIDSFNARKFCRKNNLARNHYQKTA